MATSQVHHELRYDFSTRIAALLAERNAAAVYNLRYADIGVPPATGDGGVACTGQLGVVVSALTEVLSNAVGNADFGGIAPVIGPLRSSAVGTPVNIGAGVNGVTLAIRVANLLPFPLIKLRPVITGVDVNVVAYIKSIDWNKSTSPFAGAVGVVCVGTINLAGVVPALSGGYRVVVQNPLDTRTSEVVSSDIIYLTTA